MWPALSHVGGAVLTTCQIMFRAKWKRIIAVSAAMYLSEKSFLIFSRSLILPEGLSGYIEYMLARGGWGFKGDLLTRKRHKKITAFAARPGNFVPEKNYRRGQM